ncbi:RNF213 [Symbiodinium necroappetens]|uniref:RNF213 protein n=1 Tax=Symbiodinium necroappetens TaxID=1628268 RepID=A0A813BCJ7_9DINO|nr:RNF213 [Symbiodinium necroappetens]
MVKSHYCQNLNLEEFELILRKVSSTTFYARLQLDFWQFWADPLSQRLGEAHFAEFVRKMHTSSAALAQACPHMALTMLRVLRTACKRRGACAAEIGLGITAALQIAEGLGEERSQLQDEVALLTPAVQETSLKGKLDLVAWLPALELLETAAFQDGFRLVEAMLGHAGIQQLLELLDARTFATWPFKELILVFAQNATSRHYESQGKMTATKLLDDLEELATAENTDVCVSLMAGIASLNVDNWRKAIDDEACLRLPRWSHFKADCISGLHQKLRKRLEEVYTQVVALELLMGNLHELVQAEKAFARALQLFGFDLSGLATAQARLQELGKSRRKLQLFNVIAEWHPSLFKHLQRINQSVKQVMATWDSTPAMHLEHTCQELIQDLPEPPIITALDASPRVRALVIDVFYGKTSGTTPPLPEFVDKIRTDWSKFLKSLQSGDIRVAEIDAKALLKSGDNEQTLCGWLEEEFRLLRGLEAEVTCKEHDARRIAQDLVALDEFDRYRKLIQDVNTLLKELQKFDQLVADDSDDQLRQFERMYNKVKEFDLDDSCLLKMIKEYSSSTVAGIPVRSLQAEAIRGMILEKNAALQFLWDQSMFQELEIMVRENMADFQTPQRQALQDLASLRPFLEDVLMTGTKAGTSFVIRKLAQWIRRSGTGAEMNHSWGEGPESEVGRLHKDLSQDVRGRDASLIQEMWEGIWEVGDEARLLLDSQRMCMHEELCRVRDRLVLDQALTDLDDVLRERKIQAETLHTLLQVTDQLIAQRKTMKQRGLRIPDLNRFNLSQAMQESYPPIEEMKTTLRDWQVSLESWDDVDLSMRKSFPILNHFTQSNVRELTTPRRPERDLRALLRSWDADVDRLPEEQWQRIRTGLAPPVTMLGSAVRWMHAKFLTYNLSPMLEKEALSLQTVAHALPQRRSVACRVPTIPAYLKQGAPNLILAKEHDVMPAVLSMFQDSQAGMPGASQVLLCLGLDVLFQEEALRLFLLRCMLSDNGALHVLVLPESLPASTQEYFVTCWQRLARDLQTSAGRGKYLLAIVGSISRSCLVFDAFRAHQRESPQLRVERLRQQLVSRCKIVWSKDACAGKSTFIHQDCDNSGTRRTVVAVNEATTDIDIVCRLRDCRHWQSGAIILALSPLVSSLRLDTLLFRILVLRQLLYADGEPFWLDHERIYVEIPNMLEHATSSDPALGSFAKLVTVHEVRMSNLLNLGNPTLDKATRYLWALCQGALSPSFQVSQAPRPSPEQCGVLLRASRPSVACCVFVAVRNPIGRLFRSL